MADEKEQVQVSVSTEELIPYIMKQGEAVAKQVRAARNKYGNRYNKKNRVEEMYSRFGDPESRPGAEKFAKEYMLILQKKSSLPATVRYPVRDICTAAMNECYHDKVMALYKKQQEEQKEKED
jgi:hypothetical protein